MAEQNQRYDAAIAGGGPAGLASAILLAGSGLHVAVVAHPPVVDARTVALMQPSIRLLRHIGVWPGLLCSHAQPLRKLTLVDDTGGYLAAPRVTFAAEELGHEAFGWNIPLDKLTEVLRDMAERRGAVFIEAKAVAVEVVIRIARLGLEQGAAIEATVIVAADGRDSVIRQAAHVTPLQWSYDQAALAASFRHSIPHDDTSIEYLGPSGPLTTVPLPGPRSSLVWMERPSRIAGLMAMSDKDFASEVQAATHGELGLISEVGRRSSFPMRGHIVANFGCGRIMLVGEAAHLLPPIGAQGLNLSLRDAATAAELIEEAWRRNDDIGSQEIVRRYASLRRPDVMTRQAVIHGFNHSLLADFLAGNVVRTASLALASHVPHIRSFIMRQGLEPGFHLPRAMQA
jgi:2-octaprenyl-6-methoxyphenol hydroxylase